MTMKNTDDKVVYYVSPFKAFQYDHQDIEFMLPGLIHKYFEHSTPYFEHYVEMNSVLPSRDRGDLLIRTAYYETMADVIGSYLSHVDTGKVLSSLIVTHYVDDAQLLKLHKHSGDIRINSVLIKLYPKNGTLNKY